MHKHSWSCLASFISETKRGFLVCLLLLIHWYILIIKFYLYQKSSIMWIHLYILIRKFLCVRDLQSVYRVDEGHKNSPENVILKMGKGSINHQYASRWLGVSHDKLFSHGVKRIVLDDWYYIKNILDHCSWGDINIHIYVYFEVTNFKKYICHLLP